MNKGNLMLILAQTHVQTQHGLKTCESTWLGQWDDKKKQTNKQKVLKAMNTFSHKNGELSFTLCRKSMVLCPV